MSSQGKPIGKADWPTQTEHAQEAARVLYLLGVEAAKGRRRVPYAEAAAHLHASGKGYGGVRNVLPLDALAALCATLHVPDLSSLFWSQRTIGLSSATSPYADIPRWRSIGDKELEELRCVRRRPSWPSPFSA